MYRNRNMQQYLCLVNCIRNCTLMRFFVYLSETVFIVMSLIAYATLPIALQNTDTDTSSVALNLNVFDIYSLLFDIYKRG